MDKAPQTPRSKIRSLTAAKENMLEAVADLGIATAKQITRCLAYPMTSLPYVRSVLSQLAGGGDENMSAYLCRIGMPHVPGNGERLYTLGRRGREYLRQKDVTRLYRFRKASPPSLSFWRHHLSVSDCLVALHCFVRHDPQFQLLETRPWFAMAESPPRVTLSDAGGGRSITAIPDLWACIERTHTDPSQRRSFGLWFEIDRGTETKSKFQSLVSNRIDFIRYKGYERYFGIPYVLLVYLAVGPTMDYRLHRLHTMRAWTMELLKAGNLVDWSSVFRFSTIDESLTDSLMLFTDPVCYQPDNDALVSLFTPPQEQEEACGNNQTTHLS
jgi:hypothetical protein